MDLSNLGNELIKGLANFEPGNAVMIFIGCLLIYLAISKRYEPVLLLPIGLGCILANIPLSGMMVTDEDGFFYILYHAGILTELFPLLIFIGVGAMIDFSPLLSQPKMVLLGAAGQFGIFGTLILATLLGFPLNQAASIGVIGAIDGPTSIFVATKLAPELLAPIAVAAYSYMSLIPIIQVPIMRLLTTKEERLIRMDYAPKPVSRRALIIFPIAITLVAGLLVPASVPLVSMLMLGNLLRESGVVDRLRKGAENEIINVSTLFLGLTVGATMTARSFLNWETLGIMALGLIAFILDTVVGLLFGKLMMVLSGRKINPLIGAAGISAFPMAGRLAAQVAQEEDFENFILMHAMGANTAG
ncbi:MAG: sodium ion-translocating decarboxylase subunit beta, partial [Anaerolineae bacterium]|nr:sodium ion-translocating decarboxylase subunit beta [Anaerolineae bacterium]